MGLDITYFNNLRFLGWHLKSEEAEYFDPGSDEAKKANEVKEEEEIIDVYVLNSFRDHLSPLVNNVDPHHPKLFTAGYYAGTHLGGFCAGGYGGYNRFREELSYAFVGVSPQTVWNNFDKYKEQPFAWLIHFADNEGCIGPDKCKILKKDFETHEPPADLDEWFYKKYAEWKQCFAVAELVEFH